MKWSEVARHVRFFVTPWTLAHQAPLSMRFSRQEYWSGLPFPFPGIFLTQGSNPGFPHCRQVLFTSDSIPFSYHVACQGSLEAGAVELWLGSGWNYISRHVCSICPEGAYGRIWLTTQARKTWWGWGRPAARKSISNFCASGSCRLVTAASHPAFQAPSTPGPTPWPHLSLVPKLPGVLSIFSGTIGVQTCSLESLLLLVPLQMITIPWRGLPCQGAGWANISKLMQVCAGSWYIRQAS